MRGSLAGVFGLLLVSQVANAEIYKCTGPDGKVNLTDRPCLDSAAAEVISLPPPPETGLERRLRMEAEQRAAERRKHDELIRGLRETTVILKKESERQKALFARRVSQEGLWIGMTFKEVNDHPVWGLPNKVNNTTNAQGIRSQWIYPISVTNEYEVIYLYFQKGVLTTIQN